MADRSELVVSIEPNYIQVHLQIKSGFKFARLVEGHPYAGMNAIVGCDGVIPILPMNGWRSRDFAAEVFGERDAGRLQLGVARIVRADFLQKLPGWDGIHQAYADSFTDMVTVEVVAVNPGYGCYIAVDQVRIPITSEAGNQVNGYA